MMMKRSMMIIMKRLQKIHLLLPRIRILAARLVRKGKIHTKFNRFMSKKDLCQRNRNSLLQRKKLSRLKKKSNQARKWLIIKDLNNSLIKRIIMHPLDSRVLNSHKQRLMINQRNLKRIIRKVPGVNKPRKILWVQVLTKWKDRLKRKKCKCHS